MNILAVGLGGAIGAVLRYLLGQAIPRLAGTFCINIVGCFAIGVIVALAGRNSGIAPRLVLFLQTGICGGFTTFSTFSFETVSLMDDGKIPLALLYLCASVTLGISALLAARYMVQAWE